ncbi:peptidoglycan endopeptidase [Romboutsia weinsteinii]|uniref:Peptidoglycan endopeptidase n=1 Tax=Romboutsia weinsteinii TaxID=2020949 RepID=A0A371J5H8_9FIRM|nr:peptidoglycan endopeptidase [Romboutsia weinsteinii]
MSQEDTKIITDVINLACEKIGLEYVWGGKGEIMTDERLDELINLYGEAKYPLDREDYIGHQAFDCSGLTYYTYREVTGVEIGYSTAHQKEVMKGCKVSMDNLQPGDLIYTPGHVVMYIGKGRVVNSQSNIKYPIGGVKKNWLINYKNGEVYRPIDYIKDVLK